MNAITEYKKNGVVVLKNWLDPKEVETILEEAKSVFGSALSSNKIVFDPTDDASFTKALFHLFNTAYNDFLGAAKACQHILSMHRLAISNKIETLLKEFGLAKPIICVKPIIYFNSRHLSKIEGHYKTPPHQDWRSMQGSLNSLIVWVPLVDINCDLGAVEFIKGSHLLGLLNTDSDEWFRHVSDPNINVNDFVPAEVNQGDVVIFSAFTLHRSGNNITDKIRWSMHFRYNDLVEPTFLKRGMPHPYIVYRPQQDIITADFPTVEQLKSVYGG